MSNRIAVIGAPSSAGAYAPGQEKAPAALRAIGLLKYLSAAGIVVDDRGDVSGFRWRADKANPRALNASMAASVAQATAERVASALAKKATSSMTAAGISPTNNQRLYVLIQPSPASSRSGWTPYSSSGPSLGVVPAPTVIRTMKSSS